LPFYPQFLLGQHQIRSGFIFQNGLSDQKASAKSSIAQFFDKPSLDEMQRRYITYILKNTGGKISGPGGVAEILQIKPPTLYYRMKRLGINQKQENKPQA